MFSFPEKSRSSVLNRVLASLNFTDLLSCCKVVTLARDIFSLQQH